MTRLRNSLNGKWNDVKMLPCPRLARKRLKGWLSNIREGIRERCSYTWAMIKWWARRFWDEAILGYPPWMAGASLDDEMEAGLLDAEGLREDNYRGGARRRQPSGSNVGLFESSD
ncbi:hypothetical protein PG996_013434 [Apiospora saccharicola]|uniref:Uncharacterized protein n=1 Tax=Apiospora saccharicola TaxID=335842 RepID=A0ABR1U5G9_9PEZI